MKRLGSERRISYEVREPGRVVCDDFNVFPYLDDVQVGGRFPFD